MKKSVARNVGCLATIPCLLCAGVAFFVPTTSDTMRTVETQQLKVDEFLAQPSPTAVDAASLAKSLLVLNEAKPNYLSYRAGVCYLAIQPPPPLFSRLFLANRLQFRMFQIKDVDGAFGRRWKAGISSTFERQGVGTEMVPRMGRVMLTKRNSSSVNPLEHLDFSLGW